MAVTPAGAEVSSAVATNWKKIWKKNLKPLADKRYYTKAQSDTKYASKAESAAAAAAAQAAATAAAGTATDGKLANYYTKTQGDAKYAPAPGTVRGALLAHAYVPSAGEYATTDISFPTTLKVAPTVHVIDGVAPPLGCSGTAAAPGAAPGHLCIFIANKGNVSGIYTCKEAGTSCVLGANGTGDPWGLTMYAISAAAGRTQVYGSWALNTGGVAGVTTTRVGPQSLVTPQKGSPASVE